MADSTNQTQKRRALVTGGAHGIGRAVCMRLAADGYAVAVADIASDEAARLARLMGIGHVALAVDLADPQAAGELPAKAAEALGGLDVVINNAGVTDSSGRTLVDLPQAAIAHMVAINLTAVEQIAKAAGAILKPGSCIVNLASGAAYRALALRGPYSATKAGIVALTRALAEEFEPRGIAVAAVAPGYTATPLVEELERTARVDLSAVAAGIPLGRLARPEDIASAVAFAASAEGGGINGQTLIVDGGGMMGSAPKAAGPAKGTKTEGAIVLLGATGEMDLGIAGVVARARLDATGPLSSVIDASALACDRSPAETLDTALATARACAAAPDRTADFSLVYVIAEGVSPSGRAAAAALGMLSRTLALEWARSGIRVNSILWCGKPHRRLGAVCRFLTGADASYITGQTVHAGDTL
ncbi:SDR family oxidoreductase [Martelella mediterranea]|uniref:3-oxoacyl-[acyl-carrier-protein] reductase FabG n=1 Tax=Martelella mediterranea DSM 17316 TaxID=1122214 RepID=A0A1U9Z623_9HYPH|nr:SDR family oxidoreductase [Martelella mediterranea]AQZ53032.1 3-oxoacyl-[acyl-carrier-protein] reductase FabG [Martelella mediterranea DSM 17316]